MADMKKATDAERRAADPEYARLASAEAVVADGELTPPRKLELLQGWDAAHGGAEPAGYARVADAADLGFPEPAPYSPEVQTAIAELYRLHGAALPAPDEVDWPWPGTEGG